MTSEETPPIACSLDAAGYDDRITEWRAFGRSSVTATDHVGTVARFKLADGDSVLATAASLAQREKECCPFFAFSIELEPAERWLKASVPPDAIETLSSFVALLQTPSG